MTMRIVIIGTGGVAREVTSWANSLVEITGYAALNPKEHEAFGLPGSVFPNDLTPHIAGTDLAVIAIGSPAIRRKLGGKLADAGFRFPNLVHPSAVVADNVQLGEGAIICPLVNISPNVILGRLSYVNFCVGIGHDAVIGDYTQINPGVQIGGFAEIGQDVLVGSGATIREGVKIGDKATVASGSVVLGRLRGGVTVMGNPAKRMRAFEV